MGWAIGVAAIIAVLAFAFTIRLRRVSFGGSFECAIRKEGNERVSEGWARYSRGYLDWYALASFRYRPSRSWSREQLADLEVVGTVISPRGNELLVIQVPGLDVDLLMWRSAYAGLRSWLEAAPPRASTSPG